MATPLRPLILTFVLAVYGCGGSSSSSNGGGSPTGNCTAPATIQPDETVFGSLTNSDCSVVQLFPNQTGDLSLLDRYEVTLPADGRLTAFMQSSDFDAFLVLFDSSLSIPPIAEDDDSGTLLNAMLTIDLPEGTYVIVANSATTTPATGSYTLTTSFEPAIWSPINSTGAPAARTGHTALWTGTEMIVWGGHDGNANAMNSGGRYVPTTDNWSQTSNAGVPSPRSAHTSVWTGNEMIVWGGFSGASAFETIGDGAVYRPQSNTWSPISTTDQPSQRMNHTAVWTGSNMIVWGGASCSGCSNPELGTGAKYDPDNDTWTPISNLNAPEARFNHTAVWTGSLMIVWGGESEQGIGSPTLLNSGGAYDPGNDSWTPITMVGSPLPARCHSAVWTGSEMIVFGGQSDVLLACGNSSVNSGARYNPATDAWNSVSDAPFSSTLSGPEVVWTGEHLITWFDSTGGRYDPTTDIWQGISFVGAPSTRNHHTIVWTGTRMIVWGGEFAGPLGDGARYDPNFDTTP